MAIADWYARFQPDLTSPAAEQDALFHYVSDHLRTGND